MKLLSIFLLVSLCYSGATVHAQTDLSPEIPIDHAIAKAILHAQKKEIDLNGKFIKKAEYHNKLQNTDAEPYWSVYWMNKRITKGGGVELRLYPDGSIEEKYYK